MKNVLTIALIASAMCFIACSSNNNEKAEDQPMNDSVIQETVPTSLTTDSTGQDLTIPAPSSEVFEIKQPAAGNAQPVAEGMNPAHGQPGHRCDISVGAPLNSPPGQSKPSEEPKIIESPVQTQPQTPVQTITPDLSGQSIQTTPATTAPGMNPPHGQPGHDCAIPVGSPLKK